MKAIAYIDTEIEYKSGKIQDIGAVKENGSIYHSCNPTEFIEFLGNTEYICGHNILNHDLKYIGNVLNGSADTKKYIDTLYLSPLLFPTKPYHYLLKDDKLLIEEINNPVNDSKKARELFHDEINAFHKLNPGLKQIFYCLLKDRREFCSFFDYMGYKASIPDVEKLITDLFNSDICQNAELNKIISENPVELAYCLALINTKNRYSITPPWVVRNYPAVESIMHILRSKPCLTGCDYCEKALDIHRGLKNFFGFDSYRTYNGQPLQERAVQAAVDNKSLLAIFPTGGGKSVTFQVPALMSGVNEKGLTVVISPLQSLMKDQVDNLEKIGITEAVTINGLLDPIERSKSIERVEDGSASILYISPESLRSKTIEHLLLGRNIVRFVIDEAHCFSSWGQDFRVDYLYIADFIKSIQEKKGLSDGIPVSCFTATAKPQVIEDIKSYFRDKLSLELEVFKSGAERTNLRYQVIPRNNDEDKYNTLRDIIEEKQCPTIVYVSRTKRAEDLANRLSADGFSAKAFHGKMDKQEKTKNQDAFIRGDVQIMVATSAFGMGVDKKDVGLVIHYEISDSLENYVQEAGRAGRDESITAECFVLFNDEDLSKHFILLNQTKLSIQEIQQVWKAIKDITKLRLRVSQSALEIARKAGWDDNIDQIETKVKTAINALEDAGYIRRGQNMPRIYANSIMSRNVAEAVEKINASERFDDKQRENAIRIIKSLIASRSRKKASGEDAESRIDYISDHLAIAREDVIQAVNLLREEGILAQTKDLISFFKRKESKNALPGRLRSFIQLENFLCNELEEKGEEITYNVKELNEKAQESGLEGITPKKINTVLNLWTIKHWIKRHYKDSSRNHVVIQSNYYRDEIRQMLEKQNELAQFIVNYLIDKGLMGNSPEEAQDETVSVDFSVFELKEAFENRPSFLKSEASVKDVEDALFFLSRIDCINIEGGFMVIYNSIAIERLEKDNKKRYKAEDYQKLRQFYENKVQQIHIVGEYASKMISDYKAALAFVNDYFELNYSSFLNKYFKGSRQDEIKKNITPAKFRQLFGELSPAQLKIINDKDSKYIVVAAGPGSGKTRVLVHKLASLLLMEDVKHDQLLMLTFSRAAATEFKKRLIKLYGNAANYIDIKTFHSFCFDLLGRVGSIEKSGDIIKEAVQRIKSGEVEAGRISKVVLVIDEAQDMDADEYSLISALMEYNEAMRVIAVGDDDQNIYEFRGSSSEYLNRLIAEKGAVKYELIENYRSKSNLVEFTNSFAETISKRLKDTPIVAMQNDNGVIRLIRYLSDNIIVPSVNDIRSYELKGTTCVLTYTNEEALQITGLLTREGIPARLIQSNEGFSLYNLLEIRSFINKLYSSGHSDDKYIIDSDALKEAKAYLAEEFEKSPNREVCMSIINDFEAVNTKIKFRSDLEVFIRESRLEDFHPEKMDMVYVSTIHKAKGREFDNVFLVLSNFSADTDEARRKLYVAMTRAKCSLHIHYNRSIFSTVSAENMVLKKDTAIYQLPDEISIQLTHRDVWLDYFSRDQSLVRSLKPGDELTVNESGCKNTNGQYVVKFSRLFMDKLKSLREKSFKLRGADIRFIVYWTNENSDKEIRIILPKVHFVRS